jgi:hypothetical protein
LINQLCPNGRNYRIGDCRACVPSVREYAKIERGSPASMDGEKQAFTWTAAKQSASRVVNAGSIKAG